jgi:hypothetical protein
MQQTDACPNLKTGKDGEAKPCGAKRLYRVVEEAGSSGPYWTISLGTPANPPELCKRCAILDAMARNTTARIQRGMLAARNAQNAQEPAQEAASAAAPAELGTTPDEAEAAAWESARRGDEEPGP